MSKRARVLLVGALSSCAAIAATGALAQQRGDRVSLTIYGASANAGVGYAYTGGAGYYNPAVYGGLTYGGYLAPGVPATAGFAIVKEHRTIELQQGLNDVRFESVAAQVDAGTVRFKSLTDPRGTSVVEQRFRYDLASPEALLAKYIDHEVTVITEQGEVAGTLLSYDAQQLVVRTADAQHPIHIVRRGDNVRDLRFGAMADGLVTRPTLEWKVEAARAGKHEAEVSYRTGGLSWSADYTLVWDEAKSRADLSAWVTVTNNSGADYSDASIKLVAGGGQPVAAYPAATPMYATAYGSATTGALGYDVFSLGKAVSLEHRASKQVELLEPIVGARAQQILVHDSIPNYTYYPTGYPNVDMYAFNYQARRKDADTFLEIAADRPASGALPAGKARLYKRKAKGELELVGELQVAHTPGDTPMRLRVGAQAMLEVEHKQVEFRLDEANKEMREKVEVKLSNTGKQAVEVVVREIMWRWTDWTIENESVKGKKAGPLVQEYRVEVPAGKSRSVTYTALYRW